jgi:hypothetical protein
MLPLLPETTQLMAKLEQLSHRRIEFMPVDSLPVLASLKIARHGASFHVLQYRPSNDPLDYYVAQQVGTVLRMFELPEIQRFDFAGNDRGENAVESILRASSHLSSSDEAILPLFAKSVHHWAMMQLRSIPLGMRVDAWLYATFPNMRESIARGLGEQQQMNVQLLDQQAGGLSPPTNQFAPVTAYALFTDRLLGTSYEIPFKAAGALQDGRKLLNLFDTIQADPAHDRQLIDFWARQLGMTDWYQWVPYQP